MSTAVESSSDLKRQRAIELLIQYPDRSIREIAREVGMPESTLRTVKAEHDAAKLQLVTLRFIDIRTDGGTQTRVAMNEQAVEDYAEAYAEGKPMPPMVVFRDPNGIGWLADGFHRLAAAERARLTELDCEVRLGTQRDALKFSLQANAHHAVRRTPADKRNAVLMVLNDPEWSKLSDAAIAEMASVSGPFVAKVRADLASTSNVLGATQRVTRNGKVMETANLGRKPKRGGQNPPDEDEEGEHRSAREPGCDDDKGEPIIHTSVGDPVPSEDEGYLETLPLRRELSSRCREIFDRDALAHRRAVPNLDSLKSMGLAKVGTGQTQGAWQYQLSVLLRMAYPAAWLKCAADGCTDGITATGDHCRKCYGRGYRLP